MRKTNVFQSWNINIQHSGFESILKALICWKSKTTAEKKLPGALSCQFFHGATSRKSFPAVQAHPTLLLLYSQANQARVVMAPAAGPPQWVYFQLKAPHVHTTVFSQGGNTHEQFGLKKNRKRRKARLVSYKTETALVFWFGMVWDFFSCTDKTSLATFASKLEEGKLLLHCFCKSSLEGRFWQWITSSCKQLAQTCRSWRACKALKSTLKCVQLGECNMLCTWWCCITSNDPFFI